MKKSYFLLAIVIVILLFVIVLRLTDSDSNEQKIAPQNNTPGDVNFVSSTTEGEASFSTDALVLSPKRNELISSPLKIQGKAIGSWFFEAVLPVRLEDNNGNVIATGQALAEEDWMTVKPINFSSSLDFSLASTTATSGLLILSKDNPSDLPENAGSIIVPVRFR